MFCTNCGAANQDGAKFCINCAQSLSEVQIVRKLSRPRARKVDSLQALFGFSFSRFVSPRMMKFLYALSILFAGLMAVFFIIVGFKASIWLGIFALLIGAPLIFLLMAVSSRVLLETILIIFRIADHTANIGVTNIGLPTTEEKPESRDSIQWNI
jgi:hypothetical protein